MTINGLGQGGQEQFLQAVKGFKAPEKTQEPAQAQPQPKSAAPAKDAVTVELSSTAKNAAAEAPKAAPSVDKAQQVLENVLTTMKEKPEAAQNAQGPVNAQRVLQALTA